MGKKNPKNLEKRLFLNTELSNAPIFTLCLVLSGFSSSPLSLESKLYVCLQSFVFFPLRLHFLSRRMCVREPVHAVVCLRVFVNERVQAWFPFEHLFDVAVYLFISPPVKAFLGLLGL